MLVPERGAPALEALEKPAAVRIFPVLKKRLLPTPVYTNENGVEDSVSNNSVVHARAFNISGFAVT